MQNRRSKMRTRMPRGRGRLTCGTLRGNCTPAARARSARESFRGTHGHLCRVRRRSCAGRQHGSPPVGSTGHAALPRPCAVADVLSWTLRRPCIPRDGLQQGKMFVDRQNRNRGVFLSPYSAALPSRPSCVLNARQRRLSWPAKRGPGLRNEKRGRAVAGSELVRAVPPPRCPCCGVRRNVRGWGSSPAHRISPAPVW